MLKVWLSSLLPLSITRRFVRKLLAREATQHGVELRAGPEYLDVQRAATIVRLSTDHLLYVRDVIAAFDYYAGAVVPHKSDGAAIVDYSAPRDHDVIGFDDHPIRFPSLAEPYVTAAEYLRFAELASGMTVLDLGAYSGLTAILFAKAVGASGTVVAVEADPANLACVQVNVARYLATSPGGAAIHVLHGAVWDHEDGVVFSSEGNMGSSAVSIVGTHRGLNTTVPTFTLSALADRFGLTRVDFVKVDIEGAERIIFNDRAFFTRFAPRIVIEPHLVDGRMTTDACVAQLTANRYRCELVVQKGGNNLVIECRKDTDEH